MSESSCKITDENMRYSSFLGYLAWASVYLGEGGGEFFKTAPGGGKRLVVGTIVNLATHFNDNIATIGGARQKFQILVIVGRSFAGQEELKPVRVALRVLYMNERRVRNECANRRFQIHAAQLKMTVIERRTHVTTLGLLHQPGGVLGRVQRAANVGFDR